jgi:hypothetical protein
MKYPGQKFKRWRWDRGGRYLVADVDVVGEGDVEVRIPLNQVIGDVDVILGECGFSHGERREVGANDSVDGWLKSFKKVAKRAVNPIPYEPKFIKKARRKILGRKLGGLHDKYQGMVHKAIGKSNKYAKKYGMKAARSKKLGAALGAAAVIYPAVGAPALAAWSAGNRYVSYYDKAQAMKKQLTAGMKRPQNATQVLQQGAAAAKGFQALRGKANDPRARMLMSALQSQPARQAASKYGSTYARRYGR